MADLNEISPEQRGLLHDTWKVGEDVAMHFNNLILGLRLKAIGGIVAGTVVGIGLKLGNLTDTVVIFSLSVALLIVWILVWAADFFYYYPLLAGAVDEILRLEKRLGYIHLSKLIERRVRGDGPPKDDIDDQLTRQVKYPSRFPSWPIWVFYCFPTLILVLMAVWLGYLVFFR